MGNAALSFTAEKAQNYGSNAQTITSMEVAEMVGKRHCDLMRDINRYCKQITEANLDLSTERKIALSDFFRESTYKDSTGRILPCYDITKKGCEFIAHKLTGVKGTAFTAQYVNRFHDMEDVLCEKVSKPTLSEMTDAARLIREVYEVAGVDPRYIAVSVNTIYKEAGLDLPLSIQMDEDKLYDQTEIAKELKIMSSSGKPHSQAVGIIISMLDISDRDKISTPYTNHGHSGVVTQYTGRVLSMIKEWLKSNNYPAAIAGNGKTYNVSYA